MRKVNVIAVFTPDESKWLFCHRVKDPYKGLYNLVGGKIEPGEDGLDAAYRELWEETGITREQITLTHMMDFVYYDEDCLLEVYAGRLQEEVAVAGEENPLVWLDVNQDFFSMEKFAGEGNLGHILEHMRSYRQTK